MWLGRRSRLTGTVFGSRAYATYPHCRQLRSPSRSSIKMPLQRGHMLLRASRVADRFMSATPHSPRVSWARPLPKVAETHSQCSDRQNEQIPGTWRRYSLQSRHRCRPGFSASIPSRGGSAREDPRSLASAILSPFYHSYAETRRADLRVGPLGVWAGRTVNRRCVRPAGQLPPGTPPGLWTANVEGLAHRPRIAL